MLKNRRIRITDLTGLFILILIFSAFIVIGNSSTSHFKFISASYIVPSILLGIVFSSDSCDKKQIRKYLLFCMYLFTVSIILYIYKFILEGTIVLRNGFGAGTYQNAGYCAAFAFTITLFLFDKNKIVKIGLLLVQFIGCIVSTASGPFVSCLLGVFLYFVDYAKKNKLSIKQIITIPAIIALVVLVFFYLKDSVFNTAYEAISSFFSFGKGVDLESAGRDDVYGQAFAVILQHPLGAGLFGYYRYMEYPHNIFLETMLQGGIIYTALMVFVIILMTKKYVFYKEKDEFAVCLNPIFIVNSVMLLVSGSYMLNTVFWFFLINTINGVKPSKRTRKNQMVMK
jgi:O-antigen ligase